MDYGHEQTDKELKKLENRISKEYQRAAVDVKKKSKEYMEKFKAKDKIKREQLKNGEITKADYNQWKTGQIMIGKRWEEMRDTLYQDLSNAKEIAKSMTTEFSYDVYALNHNYGTFEVESGSLMNTSYTLYDKDTVYTMIKDKPTLLPNFKESQKDIDKDKRWSLTKMNSAVLQGILQGESMDGIAKRLSDVVGMDEKVAIRNARTMTTGAENLGRQHSYERAQKMGINLEKQWIATLDSRTRDSHRMLDGEIVKINETFSNKLECPGDPSGDPSEVYNCRCTMVGVIANVQREDLRDENGNVLTKDDALGDMSYEDWKRGHEKQKREKHVNEFKTFKTGEDANVYFGKRPDISLRRENRELYNQKRAEFQESMYGKWYESLSSDQTLSIGEYSGDSYSGINGLLRHQMTEKMVNSWNDSSSVSIQDMIVNIESAIDSFELKEPIKVYRTCENDVLENLKLSVGSRFHDDGFGSTSVLTEKVASGNIVMEINVPSGKGYGAWINPLSGAEDKEFEFLLQRGSDYEVTEVLTMGDDTVVKMNLLGNTKNNWSFASKEEVIEQWKRSGIYDEYNAEKI